MDYAARINISNLRAVFDHSCPGVGETVNTSASSSSYYGRYFCQGLSQFSVLYRKFLEKNNQIQHPIKICWCINGDFSSILVKSANIYGSIRSFPLIQPQIQTADADSSLKQVRFCRTECKERSRALAGSQCDMCVRCGHFSHTEILQKNEDLFRCSGKETKLDSI